MLLFQTGGLAFGFLVPVLSGFIAYAIADRPGLVPGFVGGAIAGAINAGFLGGLATGFIGGFLALWISRWKVPKGVRGVMPVVVIPLLSSLLTGFVMFVIIGQPIASLMAGLTSWLNGLTGANLLLLGAILGAMMGFDLGGPINKVAYTFAITGLATEGLGTGAAQFRIMAAVMARRHGRAARDGAGHHGPQAPVHARRAGERQGRVAPRAVVHLRGRDPVRRGRPVARHRVLAGRLQP